MKEMVFKRKLQSPRESGYLLSVPPVIVKALDCEEVYIIVDDKGIRIEPVPLREPEIAYTDYKVKP